MMQGVTVSLDRLEMLIDEAIASMGAGEPIDDTAMTAAKGRALLALSRVHPIDARSEAARSLAEQVARVRAKLATEGALLKRRLAAAELVSSLVAEAVLAGEWDGTYAGTPAHAGRSAQGGLR